LTLSPALSAILLKPHGAPKDRLTRAIDRLFGWLFRPFNRLFQRGAERFVPAQDKQYLVSFAQLPDAASLDRTEDVIKQMSAIALKQPGVQSAVAFPGLSVNGFTNSTNAGIVFVTLKPFEERRSADLSAGEGPRALHAGLLQRD